MNDRLLTVSIAAYNVEKYIDDCLKSLLIEEDNIQYLDIIVVNDGSTDKTSQIARHYVEAYPNSFSLIEKANGGYGSTINASLKVARGKYFKLLDGDDSFETSSLNNLINYLKSWDAESDIIFIPYYLNYLGTNKKKSRSNVDCQEGKICKLTDYTFNRIPAMHEVSIKTSLLKEVKITEKCFYTDNEYVANCIILADTFSCYKRNIYIYNIGIAEQSVSINGLRKHLSDWEKVYSSINDLVNYKFTGLSGAKVHAVNMIQEGLLESMYSAYLLQKHPLQFKAKLKNFDEMLMEKDPEMYTVTNSIKKIRLLRKLKFNFYYLYSIIMLLYYRVKQNES